MTRYILYRAIQSIPTLIGISIISFALVRLTGDPARTILGVMATQEAVEEYRQEHGLNQPMIQQYFDFVSDAVRGDFGTSLRYNEPVLDLFLERLPATLELNFAALGLAIFVGIPIGVFAAVKWSTRWDTFVRTFVLLGQAMPAFYLGLILIIVFSVELRLLPTGGRGSLKNLIMPAVALGMFLIALIVRFTRSALLDVLHLDYIRTARAKGLTEMKTLFKHALRNALIPLVALLGIQLAVLFGGAIVIETIFSWPGIGRFVVQAIYSRDFPVVQAMILITGSVTILINLIIDITYSYLDPRIKYNR